MDICNIFRYLVCIISISYCSLCHSNSLNRVGAGVIPFPSNPSDTLIILDDLPDTDVYTLRTDEEYDLVFNFEISKYIGDRDKLLQHGLIEEEVKIAVATFDVDNGPESDSQLYFDCDGDGELELIYYEVDEVYLNGEKIGELTSGDEQWAVSKNVLTASISQLNFPMAPETTALNTIQIKIDVKNKDVELSSGIVGCKKWAAEVDFIAVLFDVIDPFVLIPGFGGDSTNLLASNFKQHLMDEYGIPSEVISYESPIYNPFINEGLCENAPRSYLGTYQSITNQIIALANKWQTASINLIGHSKGGLESLYVTEYILNWEYDVQVGVFNDTKVNNRLGLGSLSTFGTPFYGTKLADSIVSHAGNYILLSPDFVLKLAPGLCDLTTSRATRFSLEHTFADLFYHIKVGTDADLNHDGYIFHDESLGVQGYLLPPRILNIMWQKTGGVAQPYYRIPPDWWVPRFLSSEMLSKLVQANDIYVSAESALSHNVTTLNGGVFGYKNHGTIIDQSMQDSIIQLFKDYQFWRYR